MNIQFTSESRDVDLTDQWDREQSPYADDITDAQAAARDYFNATEGVPRFASNKMTSWAHLEDGTLGMVQFYRDGSCNLLGIVEQS